MSEKQKTRKLRLITRQTYQVSPDYEMAHRYVTDVIEIPADSIILKNQFGVGEISNPEVIGVEWIEEESS